jgi:hypothetical protein
MFSWLFIRLFNRNFGRGCRNWLILRRAFEESRTCDDCYQRQYRYHRRTDDTRVCERRLLI